MNLDIFVIQITETADLLRSKGWAEATAGNLSVDITGYDIDMNEFIYVNSLKFPSIFRNLNGSSFLITASGSRIRELAKSPNENLVLVIISGDGSTCEIYAKIPNNKVNIKPTSELYSHLGIYNHLHQKKLSYQSIVHTHSTGIIALTHNPKFKSTEAISELIWKMYPESALFLPYGVGFVPYIITGSIELAEATAHAASAHSVIVWEKHGIIAYGVNTIEALDKIEIVAKSVDIYFQCLKAGFEPEGLSEEQIGKLKK